MSEKCGISGTLKEDPLCLFRTDDRGIAQEP